MLRHIIFPILLLTITAHAQRVVPFAEGNDGDIVAMTFWDDKLVMGGSLLELWDSTDAYVMAWDGSTVNKLLGFGSLNSSVKTLETFNGDLYVGGHYPPLGNVARWDGSVWQPMDLGSPAAVRDLCAYNGQLISASENGTVCAWNGSTWDTLGTRFDNDVFCLAVHNGALYAAGRFTADVNGTPLLRMARWNGSAWEQVGPGMGNYVVAMASLPEGLIALGNFSADGLGNPLPRWALWNGSAFTLPALDPMPKVLIGPPPTQSRSIPVFSDGSYVIGDALVRGTQVTQIGYFAQSYAEYQGHKFLGGENSGTTTQTGLDYAPYNTLAEIIEGRHYDHIAGNVMKATLSPTPSMFNRYWDALPGLEVPAGDTTHAVFSISPWLRCKQDDTWYRSAPQYNEGGGDSVAWAGPLADVMDLDFYRRYHQVWVLDQWTIANHRDHWNDAGYDMPYAIATWPGNGDVSNGEPAQLAPYTDVDGNGLYEPDAGDYPLIRGVEAAYWIMHTSPEQMGSLTPACDMHMMAYQYWQPDNADLHNSTFVNMRIINRSGADYDSLRVGFFSDLDLGGYSDDLAECDSTRSLWYVYNADDLDADTVQGDNYAIHGYGMQPPAVGCMMLNQAMTAHSVHAQSSSSSVFIENAMNGTDDGAPFTQLGYPTHFQYPGGAWQDVYDTLLIDRRNVASAGPFTWPAGDTLCVDIVVMYARATSGGPYASVASLKQRADGVRSWYDNMGFVCNTINDVVGVEERIATAEVQAYPNPAADRITIVGTRALREVRLLDALGRELLSRTTTHDREVLDVSALQSGPYILRVDDGARMHTLRVVVQ